MRTARVPRTMMPDIHSSGGARARVHARPPIGATRIIYDGRASPERPADHMIRIDRTRTPTDLVPRIDRLFALSADKIRSIEQTSRPGDGAPVFTVEGRYTARGWTEWTEGFQYGSALLQFDATDEREFLELGRERTLTRMAPHLTHVGVHDHGFNNVSTYGALWRMARRGTHRRQRVGAAVLRARAQGQRRRAGAPLDDAARRRLHLLVQRRALALRRHHPIAARARALAPARPPPGGGTGRAGQPARAARAARAGDGEVQRVLRRAAADRTTCAGAWRTRASSTSPTARIAARARSRATRPSAPGRAGSRGPCSGFAEQLEFLSTLTADARPVVGSRERRAGARRRGARHVRLLYRLGRLRRWHPLLGHRRARTVVTRRLGQPRRPIRSTIASPSTARPRPLGRRACCASAGSSTGRGEDGSRYTQAGLRVLDTLFDEAGPYLSQDPNHQGLLLHSVYHWPNGWDHVPAGARIPRGESSQWGDYHAREAALYVKRLAEGGAYLAFYGPGGDRAQGSGVWAQAKTSE